MNPTCYCHYFHGVVAVVKAAEASLNDGDSAPSGPGVLESILYDEEATAEAEPLHQFAIEPGAAFADSPACFFLCDPLLLLFFSGRSGSYARAKSREVEQQSKDQCLLGDNTKGTSTSPQKCSRIHPPRPLVYTRTNTRRDGEALGASLWRGR